VAFKINSNDPFHWSSKLAVSFNNSVVSLLNTADTVMFFSSEREYVSSPNGSNVAITESVTLHVKTKWDVLTSLANTTLIAALKFYHL